jgi:hypothetical protein
VGLIVQKSSRVLVDKGNRIAGPQAEGLTVSLGTPSRLAQDEKPCLRSGEAGGRRGLGQMKLANPPGAQFEILIDGKPRSYRDLRAVAIESAEFLKRLNPHSEVAVRDLQSGEIIVATHKPE